MKNIITAAEALLLVEAPKVVLVDATAGPNAYEVFLALHLRGAIHVHLENDLSEISDPAQGGRHPLAGLVQFAEVLKNLGIEQDSHILIYDRLSGGNAAARFWWMLKAQGHAAVQVLDGGFQEAVKIGFPTDSGLPAQTVCDSAYAVGDWKLPTVNMSQVEGFTKDAHSLIIDVREAARYQGLEEPIDLQAGHIPSAINIPFKNNLKPDGLFKSKEELQEMYAPYLVDKDMTKVAVHCGSGVTACHTLLALSLAGFTLPNLYVGSWSEWSRNKL